MHCKVINKVLKKKEEEEKKKKGIVKMADGAKRFNPVYFNGKNLLDFSHLRPQDKSKVRKKAYEV